MLRDSHLSHLCRNSHFLQRCAAAADFLLSAGTNWPSRHSFQKTAEAIPTGAQS
jgi:hypothetical protein